jgi:serine-type D-Ala-D-Ala carboxypeptidase/endopeptidase
VNSCHYLIMRALPTTFLMLIVCSGASAAAAAAAAVVGTWTGTLPAGCSPLHLVLHVSADSAGQLAASLDSVDQGALGLEAGNVGFRGDSFSFDMPPVRGKYQGSISPDGRTITGTWTQGTAQPLAFTRTTAIAAPTPAPEMENPVALGELKPILDQELKPVLDHGLLSKPSGGGLVIGVLDHGDRRIFAYGTAHPDSLFEIGSITKTLTSLILAQMVVQKKVSLNQPVRTLLPTGSAGHPTPHEITLLDLATHHSGLPRMPDNFKPEDPSNPYVDYDARRLSEYLTKHGIKKPPETTFLYSNLGFGLLGYVLALKAHMSYAQLVQTEITGPLQMRDTIITMSPAQQKRLIQGYDGSFNRAAPWDFQVFAGARRSQINRFRHADLPRCEFASAEIHGWCETGFSSRHSARGYRIKPRRSRGGRWA